MYQDIFIFENRAVYKKITKNKEEPDRLSTQRMERWYDLNSG